MKEIVFHLGEETRHIVEKIDDKVIESSLFSDQYKKALYTIETMYSRSRIQNEEDEENAYNNILSFIGDRGSGKTSCVLSLAELLDKGLQNELRLAYPHVSEISFHRIRRIDPSFFDKTHNVIELFLAGLYNDFIKNREGKNNSSYVDKQEQIVLRCFADAQKQMAEMIKAPDEGYDVIEKLQNLSAGIKLGSKIKDLVEEYLIYVKKENGVLILPIDDIDLNSGLAAEMLEQIRKFLIQPNVLILLAVKMDQLNSVKQFQLRKDFSIFPDSTIAPSEDIEDMTEAYLTKLLPHQQRVYLPDGSVLFDQPVVIEKESGHKDTYPTVRQMVPELIYKKTRFLFYNSSFKTSFIVPDNLRELRFLVSLLYKMEDYWQIPTEKKHRESNQYNKLVFRKYLFENWVQNNLNPEMQRMVQRILRIQDTEQINAVVLACLRSEFIVGSTVSQARSNNIRSVSLNSELGLIMDSTNYHYNIAVGDVLDTIDMLENSETDSAKLRFLFLLRSFYSMRLYMAYDAVVGSEVSSKDTILAPSKFEGLDLSEYDKLVAGYFINTRLSRIIPPSKWGARAERPIDYSRFQNLIKEVINEEGKNTLKLQLVEFFMLGISRRYDTKDELKPSYYRKSDAVFYAESLENLIKNAYFDVGALLFNMSRIEKCYKRFWLGDIIFRIAKINEYSLLNLFRNPIKENEIVGESQSLLNHPDSYWMSLCCFNNAEVIKAFKEYLTSFTPRAGEDSGVLARTFKRMGSFSIPTYDKNENDVYNSISFGFLNIIGDLLENNSIREDFNKVYIRDDRPAPELVVTKDIIRGASLDRNRKETRIKNIYASYPEIERHYQKEVQSVFGEYGDYMTRNEIIQAVADLNDLLEDYR